MSTLTKILVVLLSLFSILLCGMIVSYIGTANNYKALCDGERMAKEVLQSENAALADRYKEQVSKTEELGKQLRQEILTLRKQNSQLDADLRNSQRLEQESGMRADSWKGLMTGFEQSVGAMLESLTLTQQQLDKARVQNIKDQKELNQITADLYEKIVELGRLEADRRRLLEQKVNLERQLTQTGAAPAAPGAVTVVPSQAKSAGPVVTTQDIRGLIVGIDKSLVTLSVGSADGVEKGMVFHITRGSDFLCNVAVTDVDIDKCAGVLEMVQQSPRVGDTASTKL